MPALTCRNLAASLPPELRDNEGLYKKVPRSADDSVVAADAGIEAAAAFATFRPDNYQPPALRLRDETR